MIRSPFFWKHFFAYVIVIAITAVTINYSLAFRTRKFVEDETRSRLRETNSYLSVLLETGCQSRQQSLQDMVSFAANLTQSRITLIAPDGGILAESAQDPKTLDNHLHRPEVQDIVARGQEWGQSVRVSDTVKMEMIYVSHRVRPCGHDLIVRVGLPTSHLRARLVSVRDIIWPGILLGGVIALIMAWVIVRRIAGPLDILTSATEAISEGQYDVRLTRLPANEIGKLGRSINRLAEAVQASIVRREKMESIRRQFTSNVSHELKTPLTSIKGYVETLLGGAVHDPEVNVRFLKIIQANIDRLNTLVNDLMQLARIEAEPEIDPNQLESVPWRQVVEEVVTRHQIQLTQKNIEFHIETPGSAMVRGERRAMGHIFENLLQNAINYTPDGGRITVRLSQDPQRKVGILTVNDSGIGIDPADQERIFERFYRVDAARSREVGGTGLGLAIVKHLVMNLKGKVSVSSQLGKGSTFTVELPC